MRYTIATTDLKSNGTGYSSCLSRKPYLAIHKLESVSIHFPLIWNSRGGIHSDDMFLMLTKERGPHCCEFSLLALERQPYASGRSVKKFCSQKLLRAMQVFWSQFEKHYKTNYGQKTYIGAEVQQGQQNVRVCVSNLVQLVIHFKSSFQLKKKTG